LNNSQRFDELPCGVIQVDPERKIQFINTYASNLVSGESAEDLIGRNIADLFSEASCEFLDSDLFPMLVAESKAEEIQLTLRKSTDQSIPIVASIKMDSGQSSCWTFMSCSKRDCLQAQLQSTQETLQSQTESIIRGQSAKLERQSDLQLFCHTLSHDLNGPLRRNQQLIGAAVDDLHDAKFDSPMVFELLDAAQRGSETLIDLSKALLEYLRVDAVELKFEPVDLNTVFATLMAIREEEDDSKTPAIQQRELPVISGDKNQLQILFKNVLDNAIKYNIKQPEVTIRSTADTDNDYLVIAVADNGIGIEESYIESIFNPFIRLNNASEYSGSGLGLSTARKIAKNHGGSIQAQSSPGQGSTFCVSLPLVPGIQS